MKCIFNITESWIFFNSIIISGVPRGILLRLCWWTRYRLRLPSYLRANDHHFSSYRLWSFNRYEISLLF